VGGFTTYTGWRKDYRGLDEKLFDWWACHTLVIKDYPYVEINFLKYPYMPVPPNKERGKIGNICF
jgi:hypothetical protein